MSHLNVFTAIWVCVMGPSAWLCDYGNNTAAAKCIFLIGRTQKLIGTVNVFGKVNIGEIACVHLTGCPRLAWNNSNLVHFLCLQRCGKSSCFVSTFNSL